MKNSTTGSIIKRVALGAAIAASVAGFSVQAQGAERVQGSHGMHGHHAHSRMHHGHPGFHHHARSMKAHGQRVGLRVPGYGAVSQDFLDGMGLNPEQLKLVEEARSAGKSFRDAQKERMKAEGSSRLDRLAAGINPQEALKQADERRAKAEAARRQVDEKWVAVWNALDANQQARVADHLKARAEAVQKRAEKRRERAEQRQEHRKDRDSRPADKA